MDNKVTADNERQESGAATPAPAAKMTLVVGLALLVGVLVSVVAVLGFFFYQRTGALNAEVRAANDELRHKSALVEEMKGQIEALSEQIHSLKDYAVARSGVPRAGSATSVVPATDALPAPGKATPAAIAVPAQPAKEKKPKAKRPGEDCELVGKSPAEQAATLQRCVALMDSPPAKPRSR